MTESENQKQEELPFLQGGGEMGALIRQYDWCSTPLGLPHRWPQSLQTSVGTMLRSPYPMFVWWGKEMIMFHNDAYVPVLGKRHPEALGKSGPVIWYDVWEFIGPLMHDVLNEGKSCYFERQLLIPERKAYKEETYFTFSYSPIPDDHSRVGGIFCVCSEDTKQVLSQRRLSTLRNLSELTSSGSIKEVFEKSSKILAANPNDMPFGLFYKVTDDSKSAKLEGAFGIPYDAPASPLTIALETTSEQVWPLSSVRATGSPVVMDNLLQRFSALPSGPWEESPTQAIIIPLKKSVQDQLVSFFISGISPRLEFDEEYRSFLALVAGQTSTAIANASILEEERERMKKLLELDKAKTAFFNNVSHEFRTPLTLMLGPLEDIISEKNKSLSKTDRDQCTTVYQNALRLLKLVNTLLDFSRIEAKRAQASYQPTDLGFFTSELASSFESTIEKAGLKYEVSCSPLSEPVYVDPEMWEKIVFNLISNALKFTFEGKITVAFKETETHAKLTVQDTGVGIPKEELPNLFKRFYRIQNSRSRSHEGTGIGLALVKELVELHGGTIDVASVAGKGTTFTVSIPKGTAHLDKERINAEKNAVSTIVRTEAYMNEAALWSKSVSETESLMEEKTAASEGNILLNKNTRILLVDDNADMLQYLKRILSTYWHVEAVKDGVEALTAARGEKPDLILSDIMMPNMNGFELLSEIRKDSSIRHIPVILLSARAGEEAAVEGLEAGADDYLVKPFSAKELIARVNTHLTLSRLRMDIKAMEKFAQANKKLKRVNTDLDNFIYTASHDLKSPIVNMEGLVKMMEQSLKGKLTEKEQKLLTMMETSIGKLKNTISYLSDVTKIAKNLDQQKEMILISEIVEDVKADIHHLIQETVPTLIEEYEVEQIEIAKAHFRSIVYNLLSNAIKYRSPDRALQINISAYKEDGFFVFSVQDNGLGLSTAQQSKLFTMFMRLHTHVEGTGIGLYIIKRIVENMHGKVVVESELNQGSTFKVYLPEPLH